MTDETYNGWTNKATWLVKLWIDNDQGDQEYWLHEAKDIGPYDLANQLQECFENIASEEGHTNKPDFFSDLMSWALAMVNWDEVAKSLIEDAEEVLA